MCLPRQGSWGVAALKHIASCSFGKDSLATILLALEHGESLDEAVYCEVMFDKTISGEVPEHRDFIYNTALPRLEQNCLPDRSPAGRRKESCAHFLSAESAMFSGTARFAPSASTRKHCHPIRYITSASPEMSRNACYA